MFQQNSLQVVAPFYGFWLDFTTQRSFAWLDKWDLRQAPDRPTARAMEKENRKSREQGRKQRSEQVWEGEEEERNSNTRSTIRGAGISFLGSLHPRPRKIFRFFGKNKFHH